MKSQIFKEGEGHIRRRRIIAERFLLILPLVLAAPAAERPNSLSTDQLKSIFSSQRYPERLKTRRDIAAASADANQIDIRYLPLKDYPLLSKFKRVRSIYFFSQEGTSVTDANLIALAALTFTNLIDVNLLNCRLVTDRGVAALSNITTLRLLGLEGTGIRDDGLRVMGEKMKLTHVNVANCESITTKGLRDLATSDTLTNLSFSVENLSQTDVLDLLTSFRNIMYCEIIDPQRKLNPEPLKNLAAQKGIGIAIRPKGALQYLRER